MTRPARAAVRSGDDGPGARGRRSASRGVQPCLWMSAGLVSYKLCDRNFDCDRCPFDAALRGETLPARPPVDAPGPRVAALCFPDDRLYAPGHTWVQETSPPGGRHGVRVGLDAFAVSLIGRVRSVRPGRCAPSPGATDGASTPPVLCELDLEVGRLPVILPVAGRPNAWNRVLETDAAPLMRSPYEDGWIAEIDSVTPDALAGLLTAEGALERSRLDLRRFRRRAAVFLFEESAAVGPGGDPGGDPGIDPELGPTLADGGEILTDLRYILGARRFLDLVGDLVR